MSTSSVSIFLFLAISFFLNFHPFCSNLLSRALSSSISFRLKIPLRYFNHLETSNSYLFYYLPVFHFSPISILPFPVSISSFFAPNLFLVPFLISNPRHRHFLFNNFLRYFATSYFPFPPYLFSSLKKRQKNNQFTHAIANCSSRSFLFFQRKGKRRRKKRPMVSHGHGREPNLRSERYFITFSLVRWSIVEVVLLPGRLLNSDCRCK